MPGPPSLETADAQFAAGQFAAAASSYSQVLAADADHYRALLQSGRIALLANDLDKAQARLAQAIELSPDERTPKALLAEVHYRRDDFRPAAALLRAVGRKAKADKLANFADRPPYRIEGSTTCTSLPFALTDPLPVVQAQINGGEPVNLFIDTGAGELVLDEAFARSAGAEFFGRQSGTYAGGRQGTYQHGAIGSLDLGAFHLENVPITTKDVRRFSGPIFGGVRVDGIIGTVLLYHFLATLDYPGGQLLLRRRQRHAAQQAHRQNAVAVPFWLAGDHYMVAQGRINQSRPMLFFVDTGLAGHSFSCPQSTLDETAIPLQTDLSREGIGGGGTVQVTPFAVDRLSLGPIEQRHLGGLYLGDFPLEHTLGFHIGGLISHQFFRTHAWTLDFDQMQFYCATQAADPD